MSFWRRLLDRIAPETRDAQRPISTWDLLRYGGYGTGLPGTPVNSDAVLSASSVAARCVDLRATLLASVPLFVYRRTANGGRERADDIPLSGALHDQASDQLSAFEAREFLVRSLDLAGNGYAQLDRDGSGRVAAIYPLRPNNVTVEQLASGRLRYQYSLPAGGTITLLQEDVLHVRGPSRDGICGLSPLAIARDNLGLMLQQNEAANGLAARGLRSSGFLETQQVLNEGDRTRLENIIDRYAGSAKAGSVMVLEGGMTYKPLSWSPEDAELLASRKLSNEDVARIFGIPPTSVGITDKATFSNTEQESTMLVRNGLAPLAKRVETALMRACLSAEARQSLYIEHDLTGLLRGDTAARYQAYATGRQWGWLSPNDVRRAENQTPIPGGDEYLRPLNMAPLGSSASASIAA
jgi:HK97 family phage portal protein